MQSSSNSMFLHITKAEAQVKNNTADMQYN